MRSDWRRFGLLAGLLILGTGASSTEGVKQADRWQREADMARACNQWDVAYQRYMMLADLFPGMSHGRMGARRARWMQNWALAPVPSLGPDEVPASSEVSNIPQAVSPPPH